MVIINFYLLVIYDNLMIICVDEEKIIENIDFKNINFIRNLKICSNINNIIFKYRRLWK